MDKRLFTFAVKCLLLVFCLGNSVLNAQAQTGTAFPSNEQIQAKLETSNVLGSHCEFRVRMNQDNDLLDVMTPAVPGATDKDYKINAVLVGKAAMNICANKVAKVRVIFRGLDGSMITALIRAGDVKAFGSRLESENELLASIDLIRSGPKNPGRQPGNEPITVAPDERSVKRALAIARVRIFSLSGRRVEVSKFNELLQSARAAMADGKVREAASILTDLHRHLSEQEELCQLQRRRR